jgi:hypothetical protein
MAGKTPASCNAKGHTAAQSRLQKAFLLCACSETSTIADKKARGRLQCGEKGNKVSIIGRMSRFDRGGVCFVLTPDTLLSKKPRQSQLGP